MTSPPEGRREPAETDSNAQRFDARLVPYAATAWSVTLVGLHMGWVPVTVVAVIAALVGAAMVVLLRSGRVRKSTATRMIASGLAVVAGFGAAAGIRMWFVEHHPLVTAAENSGWATVVLHPVDDPRPIRAAAFDGTAQVRIPARVQHVAAGRSKVDVAGSVVVFAPESSWSRLLPGQQVTARFRVSEPSGAGTTVAMLRATGPPDHVGEPSVVQQWAGTIREKFSEACRAALPPAQAGLLPGLVVGDTSALPEDVREEFRITGLTHLTAVSGANVGIVLGAVLLVVRSLGLGPRTGAGLAGLALVAFVIVARPSASVVRAATMGSIGLLALVAGRERQALPALCTAVGVLLVVSPELAVDVGFALSVSATAALIVAAPPLTARLRNRGWPRAVAEAAAMSVAAFVVTAPLVAGISGSVSAVSVVANLLVTPVLAPLTVLGAVVAVVATFSPATGEFFAGGAAPLLWWLISVADRLARVPSAEIAVPGGTFGAALVTVMFGLGWAIVRSRRARVVATVVGFGAALVWIPVRLWQPPWPGADWSFVVCDVGQGDALVLRAGDGRAVVVDTGPEPDAVDRCLRRLRIRTVPLLVLSHLHADHIGGIDGVLARRDVHAVVSTTDARTRDGGGELARTVAEAGVELGRIGAGDVLAVGDLVLRVLAPDAASLGRAENDTSVVMVAETRAGSVLLTGDAEEAALTELTRTGIDVRADVLKVPHHGSRTTPDSFLTAVRPRLAVVSAGSGNLFGHPHPDVVATLRQLGTRVLSTHLHGDIAVVRAGSGALAVVSDARGTIGW